MIASCQGDQVKRGMCLTDFNQPSSGFAMTNQTSIDNIYEGSISLLSMAMLMLPGSNNVDKYGLHFTNYPVEAYPCMTTF